MHVKGQTPERGPCIDAIELAIDIGLHSLMSG